MVTQFDSQKTHPQTQLYTHTYIYCGSYTTFSNLSHEEWRAIRTLKDGRSIIIKKVHRGSCSVVWDRADYLQRYKINWLIVSWVYKGVKFNEKTLSEQADISNHCFESLKSTGFVSEKNLNYLTYEYK